MTHIPQPNPSLGNGYQPSTSYPTSSMLAHSWFGGSFLQSGGFYLNQSFNLGSFNMLRGYSMEEGPSSQQISNNWGIRGMPRITSLASLNLLNLSKLENNLVVHLPHRLPIPIKFPSEILKFEGKPGEDPSSHIMTFHIWFSSNSFSDDSIWIMIFKQTLTRVISKWYIEFSSTLFSYFRSISTTFLNHFQLPVHYDTIVEFLTYFHQKDATHIFKNIHKWRWRWRMIKEKTLVYFSLISFWSPYDPKLVRMSLWWGKIQKRRPFLDPNN